MCPLDCELLKSSTVIYIVSIYWAHTSCQNQNKSDTLLIQLHLQNYQDKLFLSSLYRLGGLGWKPHCCRQGKQNSYCSPFGSKACNPSIAALWLPQQTMGSRLFLDPWYTAHGRKSRCSIKTCWKSEEVIVHFLCPLSFALLKANKLWQRNIYFTGSHFTTFPAKC